MNEYSSQRSVFRDDMMHAYKYDMWQSDYIFLYLYFTLKFKLRFILYFNFLSKQIFIRLYFLFFRELAEHFSNRFIECLFLIVEVFIVIIINPFGIVPKETIDPSRK